jgi:phosphoglycolate phosphatase-like HAD superfamily hydrolase
VLYLFDIDGTILLTGGAGSRALDRVFEERYGITAALDEVEPSGKTDPMIVEEVFQTRLGRPSLPDESDGVLSAYIPYLRQEIAATTGFRLMPAVVETLQYLAAQPDVALGLATGNVRAAAQVKLERAAMWTQFAFGGFGCDAADRAIVVAKAIERGLAHAARQSRTFGKASIVVVGDTPRDVQAARANGVRVIAVATGSSVERAALEAHRPDVVLDTLAELPAWHEVAREDRA